MPQAPAQLHTLPAGQLQPASRSRHSSEGPQAAPRTLHGLVGEGEGGVPGEQPQRVVHMEVEGPRQGGVGGDQDPGGGVSLQQVV